MQFEIPFEVEVRAKASSSADRETILRRLEVLDQQPDNADKDREVAYLNGLLRRKDS
jgi:hypothetical protein